MECSAHPKIGQMKLSVSSKSSYWIFKVQPQSRVHVLQIAIKRRIKKMFCVWSCQILTVCPLKFLEKGLSCEYICIGVPTVSH